MFHIKGLAVYAPTDKDDKNRKVNTQQMGSCPESGEIKLVADAGSAAREKVLTLTGLGLSILQARVYLAIAELGKGTARDTARLSKIARQDIYRVIDDLQELGLIEKIMTTPATFRCAPIEPSLSALIEHRTKQISKLQEKTREIIKNFSAKDVADTLNKEPQFVMYLEKDKADLKIPAAIAKAQTSVSGFGIAEIFKIKLFKFREHVKKAAKKGVKMRFILDKPVNGKPLSSLKIRYMHTPPLVGCVIVDDKEVFFRTSKNLEARILWSSNSFFVDTIKDYFEKTWKSLENKPDRQT